MNKRRAHEYAMKQAKKQIAQIVHKAFPNQKVVSILRYESWATPFGNNEHTPKHMYELILMGENDIFMKYKAATLDKLVADLQFQNSCWL